MVSLSTVPRLSLQSCCLQVGKWGTGEGGWCRQMDSPCVHAVTWKQMTWHLDDHYCCAEVRGSFQEKETVPRETVENTVKHRDGSVGSVVANHIGGGESSVVVTTLFHIYLFSTRVIL